MLSIRPQLPPPPDDAQLIRLRAGESHAFDALFVRHRLALMRYARRLLGARAAVAEDVVQEAFLRALPALRDPGRDVVVAAYLHRIVRNLCFDELRSPIPAAHAGLDGVAGPDDAPQVVLRRERLRELVDDLHRLPARQREAIVHQAFAGRSHAEAEGGASVLASKMLVHRARASLVRARTARELAAAA